MNENKRMLIIDDEDSICLAFKRFFSRRGWDVATAATGKAGLDACAAHEARVVFLDVRLPDIDGLEVLDRLGQEQPDTQVIMISAYGSLETITQAVKGKAFDYLAKPIDLDRAGELAERALQAGPRAVTAPTAAEPETRIIGRSHVMQEVYKRIGLVAQTDSSILIIGDTGTGKELVARAIHEHSSRAAEPFVAINCGALPENLVESELFGYAQGAFTGAEQARPGRFEAADGGTLFLDEVGELPLPMQVKLLRVLDDQRVERLGSHESIHLDVRILAATNRNLEKEVEAGRFRSDLFYRLNVIHVSLPPLRARREDIKPLAEHFLTQLTRGHKDLLTDETKEILERYSWPGNVRELRNAMEHAVVVSAGQPILPQHLPASLHDPVGSASDSDRPKALRHYVAALNNVDEDLYKIALEPLERLVIEMALERCGGNQSKASEILGIHRNTLRTKIRELDIKPRADREPWP